VYNAGKGSFRLDQNRAYKEFLDGRGEEFGQVKKGTRKLV